MGSGASEQWSDKVSTSTQAGGETSQNETPISMLVNDQNQDEVMYSQGSFDSGVNVLADQQESTTLGL